ncbi:MAG TPA: helix-turn-helix transcriptional regulator [Acidimicrobiales bacterium]|nr:helix-turn-helix transcriptional regulator [Acidimicrobiales bacterium]
MPNRSGLMVKRARRGAGLTQAELGARSGYGKSAISMYETGVREPGANAFLRLLEATGCRVIVSRFSTEQNRRARILSDLLLFASELPHRWPGDDIGFPSEVWRR